MTDNAQSHDGRANGGQAVTGGEFTCVVCPSGCFIEVEFTEDHPPKLKSLTGNLCDRGETWVRQEIENPMRTFATSLSIRGGDFGSVSLRTSRAIPRKKIFEVMDAIRGLGTLDAPINIGQVVLNNPAGTDTEIIATRVVRKSETVSQSGSCS